MLLNKNKIKMKNVIIKKYENKFLFVYVNN